MGNNNSTPATVVPDIRKVVEPIKVVQAIDLSGDLLDASGSVIDQGTPAHREFLPKSV
jgi:hypothetical protein